MPASAMQGLRRHRTLLEAALIALLFFLLYAPDHEHARLYLFMERDIVRSQAVAAGALVLFGPESTGGGNLPGGLLYWVLGLGQLVRPGLESAWILITAAFSLALATAYTFLSRIAGRRVALLGALFLFEARFIKSALMTFLNVSFLPIFSVLGILGLCEAFTADEARGRRRGFAVAGASVGMGVQFHYSIAILAGVAVVLSLLARRLGLQKPGRTELRNFLAGLVFPVSPYLVWKAAVWAGHPFGLQPSSAAGAIEGALPSLFWQLKDIFAHVSPAEWARILLNKLSYFIPLALAPLLLLPFAGCAAEVGALLARRWSEARFKVLCVTTALSSLPALYFLFVPIGVRYGIPFATGCAFILSIVLGDVLGSERLLRKYAWLTIGVSAACITLSGLLLWEIPGTTMLRSALPLFSATLACAAGLLAASSAKGATAPGAIATASILLGIVATSLNTPGTAFRAPSIAQLRAITRLIATQTGWNLEEARHRVYFINHHKEQGFRLAYPAADAQPSRIAATPEVRPHGYIISMSGGPDADPARFAGWMQSLPVPGELKDGLRNDSIRILEVRRMMGALVAPYRIQDLRRLPPYFQDIGYPYEPGYKEELFRTLRNPQGVVNRGPDSTLYYWNDHPARQPLFAAGILVNRRQAARDRWIVEVEVLGDSLSQPSEWLSAVWTQAWRDPYIEVSCEGRVEHLVLAGSIGFDATQSARSFGMHIANYSFLAPFHRRFEISCRRAPDIIAAGHEGVTVTDLRAGLALGPRRLTSAAVSPR